MERRRKGASIGSHATWILLICVFIGVTGYSMTGIAGPVPVAAQNNQQAEIEKGRVALGQACVKCHNLQPIQIQRKSAEKWRDTVFSMISRGGLILPEEIEPITAYLAANFGSNSPRPKFPTETSRGAPPASGASQQLPEGEGRAILQRSCIQCHDLETVTGKTASRDEWTQILTRMVDSGASVTPAEQQMLIQYLSSLAH